jgi:hypothetical protein
MSAHTPGPWKWMADNLGPKDEYDCTTRGPVDWATWKSIGFCDNPILRGPRGEQIVGAGGGEYTPVHGDVHDERGEWADDDRARLVANALLIEAAPDLLEAAKIGLRWLESDCTGRGGRDLSGGDAGRIRAAIAKAEGAS